MAFRPISNRPEEGAAVTIRVTRNGWQLYITREARDLISTPRAITFEWDDEDALLRISAAAPDAPGASRLPTTTDRYVTGVTTMLRGLGVQLDTTTRIPVTPDGHFSIIADLSEYTYRSTP